MRVSAFFVRFAASGPKRTCTRYPCGSSGRGPPNCAHMNTLKANTDAVNSAAAASAPVLGAFSPMSIASSACRKRGRGLGEQLHERRLLAEVVAVENVETSEHGAVRV